jgi:hypothetical protein
MTMEQPSARFDLPRPIEVPSSKLYRLHLEPVGTQLADIDASEGGVRFTARCWCEVLLTVGWDPGDDDGYRFAHTSVPDQHPLHSEAIEARVLNALSNGEQLLRGNTVFAPGSADTLMLEVWHDSQRMVSMRRASLVVRRLDPDGE